jgi:hypothetical protein
MRLIKPIPVTDAKFGTSNIAEPDTGESVWNAGTSYNIGDVVVLITGGYHRKYRRLISGTTPTTPALDAANWVDIGPTNRWAMFDDETNTQTTNPASIVATVNVGQNANGLALIELVGSSVTITVKDTPGGTTVYTTTVNLEQSLVLDWYQYFFEPFSQKSTVVLTDLPPYPSMSVTMSLNGIGVVKCGGMIIGTLYSLGTTSYNATAGIRDYSTKDTNTTTGIVTLVPGKFSKRLKAKLQVRTAQVGPLQQLFYDIRATPCFWIGDDSNTYDSLQVFGFYRDFELDVAYPEVSFYSIDIEGMT